MTSDPEPRRVGRAVALWALALSLVAVTAWLVHPPALRSANDLVTDAILSVPKSPASPSTVAIVDIDDGSLAGHGQWPWPRHRLARLLKEIAALGPRGIGLDMILAEPDRTSPESLRGTVERELGGRVEISGIPPGMADPDRYLAEVLAKGPFLLGYEFTFGGEGREGRAAGLHPVEILWRTRGDGGAARFRGFDATGAVVNRALFSDAVSASGFLNAVPDGDGILRRVPLLIRHGDRFYPSFPLAALLREEGLRQLQVVEGGRGGLLRVIAGARAIPVDGMGNVAIHFNRLSGPVPRISAGKLLDGVPPAVDLRGKTVLVGSSAAGLARVHQTPGMTVPSDVELHARLLEHLRTGPVAARADGFVAWEALAGIVAAALVALSVARAGIVASGAVAAGVVLLSWAAALLLFREHGLLFSPLLPTFLAAAAYPVLTAVKSRVHQGIANEQRGDALVLLKASERNLTSIINSVPDIIFRLDPAGRITFVSPAVARYTDAPDRLLGHPIIDLVAPDDLEKARYRLNEKRTGARATYGLEIRLLLPHGQDGAPGGGAVCFSVSASGVYGGDVPNPAGFLGTQGIMRDVTDRKRLEERLLRSQKMEVVGNLAAGVAHDLNNILSGLVAYPELLLLDLPEDSPMRAGIERIHGTGLKAAAIVEDLLTLARRGVRVSEPVSLNQVVSEYLASPEFAVSLQRHPNVSVATDLAPDLLNVMGARAQLSKVVMNSLSNAMEAMPAGGTIRIATSNRFLDTAVHRYESIPAGEYACLSVSDEGVGIAPEDQQKIFEPFYSRKVMKRSGSGLGMTVIWATVKDYGGYIDIRSREGEGTEITFHLPAARGAEEPESRRVGLEEYVGTERILVVDDLPDQVEIASRILSKLGYGIATASTGEGAVEFLRRDRADLVVLDMVMPGGMDGLDTYRRILEVAPGQRVVIASGFADSDRVRTALELGAAGYVRKPYTMEAFGMAVRRALDGPPSPPTGTGVGPPA